MKAMRGLTEFGRQLPRMRWRGVPYDHDGHTYLVKRLGPDVGPQIVLVHGIGVGSRYYAPLARVLARTAGVHALELPGFGGAPKPESPLSVEELAAVVNAYIRAASLDQPVLVGHSMGSQVVMDAVLQDPSLVPVVVAMSCVVDPGRRTALQQGLRLLQDCLRETVSANWTVLSDYARTGPRWYLRTVPSMLDYRTEEAVTELSVPLLIVRGARDPIAGHDWAEQLRRLAPDARLVEVPRAAHVVMYTHPEKVAALILTQAKSVALSRGSRDT